MEAETVSQAPQVVGIPTEEPDPAQRPARLAMYLGVVFVVAGAVALYLGYNGAATNPLVQAQFPYLISGGLVGLALVLLGGITIGLHVLLRVQADFRGELSVMRESMEQLADVLSRQAFAKTNGASSGASASNGMVIVARGANSFHRADCRLVASVDRSRPMPREEADRTGLIPCRICKP